MKKILISVLVLLLLLGVDFYSVSTTQTTPNLTKMFFTQNEEMSFLSAGSVTTDKETVHQGETIDVYVALETDSIGWAVFFDIQNGVNLISNEQTIPTFEHNEEGSGGEIFYAQPEAPYTTYEVGTFIAAKQYTVSETAQLGSYITINVSGILLDEDWETHDIYGSVTVQVIGRINDDGLTIRYAEKDNLTNELYSTKRDGVRIGSDEEYTVPEDYIFNDGLWRTEDYGDKIHTITEGINIITIEYEKVLEDVTINYVEEGNSENILYTEIIEDIQVGLQCNYANPKDYTKNNLLWRTENYGERDYTVIESENIIIIEYEKVLKDIIIMYAEEYTTNELYTTTIKDIQAGTEYEYIIEEDYIKNGLLWRTEDFGTKTYTVTDGINIIVVGYKKVLEDITINYVEEGNNENILYTRTVEDIQVGTVYSYTVPEIYTDAEHIEWILIETTNLNRNYKVEEGTNIVLVEYEKVLKDVVIRYVEKGNPANVLYSTKQESIRIGTDCEYTVEEDYIKDGLLWRTTNYGTKTYKVVGGTNIITIEYEKVLKDVTINYVEKDNHANVVETITEKIQAGTQYEYLVPKDYTKNNLLWRTTDFGNKTYTVIEGENEIIVEYVKVLANIVIKYIDTEKKSVIVYTISEEDIQVGTIYSYTVPTIHIDEEETQWILIDQTSLDRNYTIEEGNNEILIEYIKEYAIILDKISITMEKGSTKIIIATIEPEDSTERTLIWSSEDINIASVDQDGVVTGIATGTTIITVITENGYRKAECTVTVKNNITEIIDEVFEMVEEEGKTYITNILEKTKVEDVKEVLDLDGYIVEIVNSKQEELELDDYVGTGSILRITDEETGVTKEYIIIVKGDVDGDGKVTATDLAKIRRHLAEIELLEGIFKKGAGMTTWGEVTATDLAKTRRHLAGIEHIK